jgi:hypothetical protein
MARGRTHTERLASCDDCSAADCEAHIKRRSRSHPPFAHIRSLSAVLVCVCGLFWDPHYGPPHRTALPSRLRWAQTPHTAQIERRSLIWRGIERVRATTYASQIRGWRERRGGWCRHGSLALRFGRLVRCWCAEGAVRLLSRFVESATTGRIAKTDISAHSRENGQAEWAARDPLEPHSYGARAAKTAQRSIFAATSRRRVRPHRARRLLRQIEALGFNVTIEAAA